MTFKKRGRPRKLAEEQEAEIAAYRAEHPDMYFKDVASFFSEKFGRELSGSAIFSTLDRRGVLQNKKTARPRHKDFIRYLEEPDFLSPRLRFDLSLLPDVLGRRVLQLQCDDGTAVLSLARLGAAEAVGYGTDLRQARRLLKAPSTENVRFTEKVGVYGGNEMLGPDGFDVVYMAIGTLGREKDLLLWAKTVTKLLRPGGSLFLREKHPIVDAIDENHRNRVMITKPYFRNLDRIAAVSAEDKSFTETEACPERQYSVGEIIGAVAAAGLMITSLSEHNSVPWEFLEEQMAEVENGTCLSGV